MLYGWRDQKRVFVGAADTLDELVRFYDLCPSVGQLPLIDPLIGNAALFCIVIHFYDFPNDQRATDFVNKMPVHLVGRENVAQRQVSLIIDSGQRPPLTRELTLKEELGLIDYQAEFSSAIEPDEEAVKNANKIRKAQQDVRDHGRVKVEEDRTTLADEKKIDAFSGREFYYFNVDLTIEQIKQVWSNEDRTYLEMAAGYGSENGHGWFAFPIRGAASRFRSRLEKQGHHVSVIELINPDRQVISSTKPMELRPWTDEAAWHRLTGAEQASLMKQVQPQEFLFARIVNGVAAAESWTAIVPDAYFLKKGNLFPTPLTIDKLLPKDFERREPGIYVCNRDWRHVEKEMIRKKFQVSMAFNILANRL